MFSNRVMAVPDPGNLVVSARFGALLFDHFGGCLVCVRGGCRRLLWLFDLLVLDGFASGWGF
ncbi:hypothetical protein, partial [Microbispora rosea]|uniref:hypothetical protein n=1 Tax=Microbispora rosea TaxID=58117 RepID=UPI001950BB9A